MSLVLSLRVRSSGQSRYVTISETELVSGADPGFVEGGGGSHIYKSVGILSHLSLISHENELVSLRPNYYSPTLKKGIWVVCHSVRSSVRHNFVSAHYLENKSIDFHQILYMHSY